MEKSIIRYLIIFPMLGTIMFISKLIMEFLPNIHAVAMFIAVFTLVYRWKALIAIYVYASSLPQELETCALEPLEG